MAAGVQLVGTLAGGALGGPIGAAAGGVLGGIIGSAIFPPPPIYGPRLDEIRVNNSNSGAPIKRLYGSGRPAPTLIHALEIEEVERKRKEGGLFGIGGQEIIEYEYYATLAFALGEPADAAGVDIRRIWANGELIYSQNELTAAQLEQLQTYLHLQSVGFERGLFGNSDPSGYIGSAATAQKFEEEVLTIYRGTEDQEADPTIQSYVGAENTPAYKGLAYFVFKRWDITRWQGLLPTIEVEYVNGPTTSISAPEWRNEVLYPWNAAGETSPENCRNNHEYNFDPPGSGVPIGWGSFDAARAAAETHYGYELGALPVGFSVGADRVISPYDDVQVGEEVVMYLYFNNELVSGIAENKFFGAITDYDTSFGGSGFNQLYAVGVQADEMVWWTGKNGGFGSSGIYYVASEGGDGVPDAPSPEVWVGLNNCVPAFGCQYESSGDPFYTLFRLDDAVLQVRRVPRCPDNPCAPLCDKALPKLPADERYCVDPISGEVLFGGYFSRYDSGSKFAILTDYSALDPYPSGYYEEPAVPDDDARYPDVGVWADETAREYWERVHRDAGERGILPDGWEDDVYGVDYPVIVESPEFRVLAQYETVNSEVTQYPLSPAVPEWSQYYDSQTFWEDAFEAQREAYVALPTMQNFIPGDWEYGVDYPTTQDWICARFPPEAKYKRALPITLQSVVEDISTECGFAPEQIDATALTKTLWGYERNAVMTGRDALEQLRTYGFFDAVESGTQIRFVPRGGAVVRTLTADDLGAHVDGEQPPPAIVPSRVNDIELPRSVLVNYPDIDSNYQVNTQRAGRSTVGEQNTMNVSLAITAEAATMKGVANAVLYDNWAARNRYEFALLREHLALEPTDPIILPVDSQDVRMRITQIDHDPRGVLKLQTVREEATAFVNSPDDAGNPFPVDDGLHPWNGPTVLTVIDGPALDESGNNAGLYLAARGTGTAAWPGCLVFASQDGTAYEPAITLEAAAQMGVTSGALAQGPHQVWDHDNTLTVVVPSTVSLLSITDAEALAGGNRCFVGEADRWELLSFATAALVSDENGVRTYALTDLLRGLQGTEWAITLHEDGDTFVMAASLSRLALPADRIGLPLWLKAVTAGTSIDNTTAQEITPAGVALECYAPVLIRSVRETSGDIVIEWQRRARISGEWRDYVDVPLNEDSEAYEVEILAADGTVLRTLTSSTSTVTYTSAQADADFDSAVPEAIDARVYQLSALAGRGYAGSGTI